jgi:hypothetical protein
MIQEDLTTISQTGRVLWADPEQADLKVVEAFSAALLLEKNESQVVESTALALLEHAIRLESGAHRISEIERASPHTKAFFRLDPKGRFILGGLHLQSWTYSQLGALLRMDPEDVEKRAWGLRLEVGLQLGADLPVGAPQKSPHCPEYDPRQPWTQRFLDEEFKTGTEKVFFQNHLMACDTCRRALSCCRDLYYAVDAAMPRQDIDGPGRKQLQSLWHSLESITRESEELKAGPTVRHRRREHLLFFLQWDVLLVMSGLAWLFYLALHPHFR